MGRPLLREHGSLRRLRLLAWRSRLPSSRGGWIVLAAAGAALLVSCHEEVPDLWAEEPDYSGAPTQLCEAGKRAAEATFGKLLEFEGPMLLTYDGSPVLGSPFGRGDCLVTCYSPHTFPDTTLQRGDRVRLRGRIRQYVGMSHGEFSVQIELDPCVFRPAR